MNPPQSDAEDSETEKLEVDVSQNQINLEKEAMNTIQIQSDKLDTIQSQSTGFSLMKFLRRDKTQSSEVSSSSTKDLDQLNIENNNGLPSYTEATMDSLTLETQVDDKKVTFADGATQTSLAEVEISEKETESTTESEVKEENVEESKPKELPGPSGTSNKLRFFSFIRK